MAFHHPVKAIVPFTKFACDEASANTPIVEVFTEAGTQLTTLVPEFPPSTYIVLLVVEANTQHT